MVDASEGFGKAVGAPQGDTTDWLRSQNQDFFGRQVEQALGELRAAKETLEQSPMLHRDKKFHSDGCDVFIDDLSNNPTQRDLIRAKHHILGFATLFRTIEDSTTDPVTGLPNRKALTKEVERVISDLQHGEASSAAILFIDLNRFKPINDELGHDQGDEALKLVGQKLQGAVRKSDVVARIGGDEFVVLLHHNARDHNFTIEQSHIDKVLNDGIIFTGKNGKEYSIGGAVGFEIITPHDMPDTAIKSADAKMFENKRGSRGLAEGHEPPALDTPT